MQWKCEFGGTFFLWDEAWVWGTEAGYALFTSVPPRWELRRLWIHPDVRRRGLVTAAWPVWQERYGDFFWDREYESDAMKAFLASRATA